MMLIVYFPKSPTNQIRCFITNRMPEKALDLFDTMTIEPDHVTLVVLLNVCAQLASDRAKTIGKKLLQQISNNYQNNNIVLNTAIHMLMKFGDIKSAENIFYSIKNKDNFTFGAMMKGYVENEQYEKVFDLYEEMNIKPDDIIYIIVLNACAGLSNYRAMNIGKQILQKICNKWQNNKIILTSGIDMLMNFGNVNDAENLFRSIQKKDIIAYGAMMNGYNMNNQLLKCFELFEELKQNLVPDEIIFNILIGTCAQIGLLSRCKFIFNQIPLHMQHQQRIQNALINMWGKSGSIDKAYDVFQSVASPNIITHTSMINAFGLNGMGFEAVNLYKQISIDQCNDITHICVLNACSHSGLLNQARIIFNNIHIKTEKIITTMIDCLSRLFLFDEAERLIDDFEKSNQPNIVMYMALLSGARNHGNIQLSEKIYNRIKSLFPDEKECLISGAILLSNVYSSRGEFELGRDIRYRHINKLKHKVKVGLSWTEVNGELVVKK
ncbi:unnamed protein product [Rotaria sp. Silwood1]|nr:unnamed protein product [Rotaria sp. Silwood1]